MSNICIYIYIICIHICVCILNNIACNLGDFFFIQHKLWEFTQIVVNFNSFPFLLLSSLIWYMYYIHGMWDTQYYSLFNHSSNKMIKFFFSTFWLLWIKLLQTSYIGFLCEHKFSFLWDKCSRVELLGCIVIACFTWNCLTFLE